MTQHQPLFDEVVYRETKRFIDSRGTTTEFFSNRSLPASFHSFKVTQMLESTSAAGVIRGIHYSSLDNPQSKIVRCLKGQIKDVVVDLRPGSATFGEWKVFELSDENSGLLYIPHGFGHAYEVISSEATVIYALDTNYQFEKEYSINPLDKDLSLPWTNQVHSLSEKDLGANSFQIVRRELCQYYLS
jgi:dTDP-4-dehydrorhamnose 3,5-epimerase